MRNGIYLEFDEGLHQIFYKSCRKAKYKKKGVSAMGALIMFLITLVVLIIVGGVVQGIAMTIWYHLFKSNNKEGNNNE